MCGGRRPVRWGPRYPGLVREHQRQRPVKVVNNRMWHKYAGWGFTWLCPLCHTSRFRDQPPLRNQRPTHNSCLPTPPPPGTLHASSVAAATHISPCCLDLNHCARARARLCRPPHHHPAMQNYQWLGHAARLLRWDAFQAGGDVFCAGTRQEQKVVSVNRKQRRRRRHVGMCVCTVVCQFVPVYSKSGRNRRGPVFLVPSSLGVSNLQRRLRLVAREK